MASHPRLRQPNSTSCFVCGLDNREGFRLAFYETSGETVEAEATIPEHHQGYPGVAHGGIVTALLDEVAMRAAVVGEPEHLMLTGRLEVRFRSAVPVGQPLRLVGRLVERRRRTARAQGEVLLPDGTVGAEVEGLFVDHPESGMDSRTLLALGWRVVEE